MEHDINELGGMETNMDIEHNTSDTSKVINKSEAKFHINGLDKTKNNINMEHNGSELSGANNNIDADLNIIELGRTNENVDIEHNVGGADNTPDANWAHNIEKKGKIYKFNLF